MGITIHYREQEKKKRKKNVVWINTTLCYQMDRFFNHNQKVEKIVFSVLNKKNIQKCNNAPKVMQLVHGEGRLTPGLLNSDEIVFPSHLRQLNLEMMRNEKGEDLHIFKCCWVWLPTGICISFPLSLNCLSEEWRTRAEEMARWLRAVASLQRIDSGQFPAPTWSFTATDNSCSREADILPWSLWAQHVCSTQTCRQNAQTHKIRINTS